MANLYKYKTVQPATPDHIKKDMKERLIRSRPIPYQNFGPQFKEYVAPKKYRNEVYDFMPAMGMNPNERYTPPAHIDNRTVYIDNASDVPVGIAINNSPFNPPPNSEILFILQPSEGRYILINSQGGSEQYLWPFKAVVGGAGSKECLVFGFPRILARNANSFVLKRGVEGIWILTFQYPSTRGAS
jgi:hypothetical protein